MQQQNKRLLEEIEQRLKINDNKLFVIGIDGNCGSGKTTVAESLSQSLNCDVIHIDDFFLPKELRTNERLNEIAGNFHYERFEKEILKGSKAGHIRYKKFDCKSMEYTKDTIINIDKVLIIEGSYSFSHDFYKAYDFKIFLKCDINTQIERLTQRAGKDGIQQFINRWIPMENRYFECDNPEGKADVVIDTSESDKN